MKKFALTALIISASALPAQETGNAAYSSGTTGISNDWSTWGFVAGGIAAAATAIGVGVAYGFNGDNIADPVPPAAAESTSH